MSGSVHPAIIKFRRLTEQKRNVEAELKSLNEQLRELQDEAIDAMLDDGVSSVKIEGYTVYISSQVSASPADGNEDAMCDALVAAEYGDLVKRTVHRSRLASFVKDFRNENDEIDLPPGLRETIKVTEFHRLQMRKA